MRLAPLPVLLAAACASAPATPPAPPVTSAPARVQATRDGAECDQEHVMRPDGFPTFSPDGRKLVFASNRNGSRPGETNLFLADWVE